MNFKTILIVLVAFSMVRCLNLIKQDEFPIILQDRAAQCGPVCLQMVTGHYGRTVELEELERLTGMTDQGTSLLGVNDAAESLGFKTLAAKIPFDKFVEEAPLPAMVHWKNNHFTVVYQLDFDSVWVADPAQGKVVYAAEEFLDGWIKHDTTGVQVGVVLLFEPTQEFYQQKGVVRRKLDSVLLD